MKRLRTNRTCLLTVALAVATLSGAALAQQSAMAPARIGHIKLDANGDGVIDRAEAAKHARLAVRFDQLDSNGDGKLSADERPQHQRGKGGRGMHGKHGRMQADINKDGRITREEAAANPKLAAKFAEIDGNGDGVLDRSDWQAKARARKEAWFATADSNRDGRLSLTEMEAASAKRRARHPQKAQRHSTAERFGKLDSNGDGSVTREEIQARHKR